MTGAPRIAPFFADLDPSAGGRVFLDSAPDAMTITWCAVPGFGLSETISVQAALFSGGAIEFRFGAAILTDGIVALSPGHADSFTAIDLKPAGGRVSDPVPIGEQFIGSPSLDLVEASRRFYQTHPDDFDQLVFFTDTTVITDAFAFETTVKNAITGTGLDVVDFASELGSAGALQSVINMDRISKYSDTPVREGVRREQRARHPRARDRPPLAGAPAVSQRRPGDFGSAARPAARALEFLHGFRRLGDGRQRDRGPGRRHLSHRLVHREIQPPGYVRDGPGHSLPRCQRFFYIDAPISGFEREDGAIVGVTITGTRRDVLIQDVIGAMGARVPTAADSPKVHRQAYVFVRRATAVLDPQDLTRLGRIREQFGPFFNRATEDRMTVRTTLTP